MFEVNSLPTVAILLPTFNGEAYLEKQLESILDQKNVLTKVYIRDDASTDSTVQILQKYTKSFEIIFSNTNIGTTASLLKLLHLAKNYDYVAFCDQDDIWASDHLFQGVQGLTKAGEAISAFYFPQYNFIDTESKLIRKRMPVENIGPSNALVENPIIGCGLVFNNSAAKTIKQFDLDTHYFLDHQIYFLATLIGKIFQGSNCTVNYRIHDSNQVGISSGRLAPFKNFVRVFFKLNHIRAQQAVLRKLHSQVNEIFPQVSLGAPAMHFRSIYSRNVIVRLKYIIHPQFQRQKPFDQILFRLIFGLLF